MGGITLPMRQSLTRRVQTFGGLNGRAERLGSRRVFRFGDISADRATVEAALNSSATGSGAASVKSNLINVLDWAALYAADPAWTRSAYQRMSDGSLDSEYQPNIDVWLQRHGSVPTSNTPVTTDPVPVTVPTPSNPPVTGPVTIPGTTPGTTDAEYQAAIAAMQVEAARLAALATANQAVAAAEAKQKDAEDEAAYQAAVAANAQLITPKKSNAVPWLVAAGLAFLALKG